MAAAGALGDIGEASQIAGFEGLQPGDGLGPPGVVGTFGQVVEFLHCRFHALAAEAAFAAALGFQHFSVKAAQGAGDHFALDPLRQPGKPAPVVGGAEAFHLAGQLAQGGLVFGQVDPVGHDAVEQGLGGGRQLAGVVALGLQALQDAEQGGGHVQVVGADVLPAGRVVVIDDGQALVGPGLGLELLPAGRAGHQAADLDGDGLGAAQLDAGDGVDAAGPHGRHHDGLADTLELGQGDPVLHGIHRQPFRRQAPLGGAALGEADGLDDRDVESLEGLGDGLAVLCGADDEVLEHHQGGRTGRGEQGGQTLDGLPGAASPAGQDLGAGQVLAAGFRADRGGRAGFDVGQVQYGQGRAGGQQTGVPGVGIDAFGSTDTQAQAGLRPGRGQGAARQQVLEQPAQVVAATGLPSAPGVEPLLGCRGRCGGGEGLRGRDFCGQLTQGLGGKAAQRTGLRAAQQVEALFAVDGQHGAGAAGGYRVDEAPRRIAEGRDGQHGIGVEPLAQLPVTGRLDLGRGAQQDAVAGVAGEVLVGGFDSLGRGAVGDDAEQGGGVGTADGGEGGQGGQQPAAVGENPVNRYASCH